MIEVFSCCCVISIEIFSISTSKILVGLFGTDDKEEGMTAFIEKRKPQFRNQ